MNLLFLLAGLCLVCLVLTLPRRLRQAAMPAAALGLLFLLGFRVADGAVQAAYGRDFNPVIDLHLASAGMRLIAGTLGLPVPLVGALAGFILPAGLFVLLWGCLRGLVRLLAPTRPVRLSAALAIVASVGAIATLPAGNAFAERVADLSAFRAEMAAFDRAALADRDFGAGALQGLEGSDVILVFVESYGRASFDAARYAAAHDPLRAKAQTAADIAGVATVSGWLTSPIAGGQSWLAHATLNSGLKVGDQGRYGRLLASGRATLFQIASRAGYHTAAYMPAITMPWPESERLGFARLFPESGLGYRGPPFNWVTMPDQFTLQAFERLSAGLPQPRFSQIVLISSHAPFTPVPPTLPDDAVGDGTVYARWATSGDPPEVVWRDRERVRNQYRDALSYALDVTFDFARRQAASGKLVIVVGDHAPAQFISQIESLDVPMHVFGPPHLVARFGGGNRVPGLRPGANAPALPMEAFRDMFLSAFGAAAGAS